VSTERSQATSASEEQRERIDKLARSISGLCHTVIARRLGQFFEVIGEELQKERAAPEPPYRVRSFWSPCKRYILNVCVSDENISIVDDNGDIWEATGPEQDMTKVGA
jgi:hypothetical protein